MTGRTADHDRGEDAAAGTVARAVARLDPESETVCLVRRGDDPLWTRLVAALAADGRLVTEVPLAAMDRSWRLPAVDDAGRMMFSWAPADHGPAGTSLVDADVLVFQDPFGTGIGYDSDLRALYRLIGAGIKVVFAAFPHGLSDPALAERVRAIYLAAYRTGDAALEEAASSFRDRLERSAAVRIRCGALVLKVSRPYTVRDDFSSARLDVPVLQLPYGEVWIVAPPTAFNGCIEVIVGRRTGTARVHEGELRWLDGEPGPDLADVRMVEIGLGFNPAALVLPGTTMFEKAQGALHVGFGDSLLIGGGIADRVHFDLPVAAGAALEIDPDSVEGP